MRLVSLLLALIADQNIVYRSKTSSPVQQNSFDLILRSFHTGIVEKKRNLRNDQSKQCIASTGWHYSDPFKFALHFGTNRPVYGVTGEITFNCNKSGIFEENTKLTLKVSGSEQ